MSILLAKTSLLNKNKNSRCTNMVESSSHHSKKKIFYEISNRSSLLSLNPQAWVCNKGVKSMMKLRLNRIENAALKEFALFFIIAFFTFILIFTFHPFEVVLAWFGIRANEVIGLFAVSVTLVVALSAFSVRRWKDLVREIKERKEAEKELNRREKKYRDLVENINEVTYSVDINGMITYISPAAESLTGYKPPESIGKPFPDFIHPQDLQKIHDGFKDGISGRNYPSEFRILTKSGDFVWVTSYSRPIKEGEEVVGLRGVLTDITEQKATEEKLEESEKRYRNLVELNPEAIAVHCQGEVVYANRAALKLVGAASKKEVIGKSVFDFVHPDHREIVMERIKKSQQEEHSEPLEEKFIKLDGEIIDVEVTAIPINYQGKPATQVVVRDVTEEKEAKERLFRQNAVLEGINRVFEETLTCETDEEVAKTCLAVAEELTDSNFGFICEINQNGRYDTTAISDPGWKACRMTRQEAETKINDVDICGIRGKVLEEQRSMLFNDPASDPDWVGVPEGHPPITSFLGVPLIRGCEVIGMIGLGNKESGYNSEDEQAIE